MICVRFLISLVTDLFIITFYQYKNVGLLILHCKPFGLNYSALFGICTVVGLNGTLVEAKIRTFKCTNCVI
jgi:hypothetical protein